MKFIVVYLIYVRDVSVIILNSYEKLIHNKTDMILIRVPYYKLEKSFNN